MRVFPSILIPLEKAEGSSIFLIRGILPELLSENIFFEKKNIISEEDCYLSDILLYRCTQHAEILSINTGRRCERH